MVKNCQLVTATSNLDLEDHHICTLTLPPLINEVNVFLYSVYTCLVNDITVNVEGLQPEDQLHVYISGRHMDDWELLRKCG